jgi:hypothetical protein
MKQRIRSRRGISLAVTVLIAACALAVSAPAGASITGTVTSVEGDASVGESPAEMSSLVSKGESIVTGPDASCSVLVDRRSLLQFCGEAAVRLDHDAQRNATILEVMEGSTRTLVGPRPADEPLEIHTPVAIAVILGTVLSVTVDPATGDSTFALEEGKARIETRDPTLGRSFTLNAGEQVTVYADGRASKAQPFDLRDVFGRKDCMDDSFFHAASLEIARKERYQELTDEITRMDIPGPDVAAPGPEETPFDPPDRDPFNPCNDPCGCSAVCTGNIPTSTTGNGNGDGNGGTTSKRSRRPPPCGGVPGEHCY